mgnify:CR=1 FL=1
MIVFPFRQKIFQKARAVCQSSPPSARPAPPGCRLIQREISPAVADFRMIAVSAAADSPYQPSVNGISPLIGKVLIPEADQSESLFIFSPKDPCGIDRVILHCKQAVQIFQ